MNAAPQQPLAHRRIRAPREHGAALIDPPLSAVGGMLQANLRRLQSPTSDAETWITALSTQARSELHRAAVEYSSSYLNLAESEREFQPTRPLILSGHQPTLFHAGVWFKNFVLSALGSAHDAQPINLIVDNDIVQHATLRVPYGDVVDGRFAGVPLDAPGEQIPYEEQAIVDAEQFDSLATRVSEILQPAIRQPVIEELWQDADAIRRQFLKLGSAVAALRHRLERRWGQRTLEVPLSHVYRQQSFRRFAMRLLADLPRFRDIYNSSLAEYRSVNGVRSRAHPVPDLDEADGWLEAPLWIWSEAAPHRRRVFVKQSASGLEITDRDRIHEHWPGDVDGAASAWGELETTRGIKIRPRALMTTLFARLVLSDLFIHGIGGAKYDELTDAIILRYFDSPPPQFLTVTATITLPLDYPRVSREELLRAEHRIHELRYHAERYSLDDAGRELAQQKLALLERIPPRGEKKIWHRKITALNDMMFASIAPQRATFVAEMEQLSEQHRIARLLGSREYSFCIFPKDFLQSLLLDLSAAKA